ncbi:hypothetical protein AMAG_02290 [Allomyces macrogynus ATCC 38327]|uniref:Uncharacterized protein n=1 Tax=Allomyces macrogynus (strain ATCC 38327) TaxID=578462 RepID=A0A0L0S270_ALLM3|nr:hypothetical protein AMAG_02290 [Allomyces macrogynus ATCC 38327]|eukprot:KNE56490.1 hypothetical protein AMAG_02290 [Allomyces macrogynus ATCC 38327]
MLMDHDHDAMAVDPAADAPAASAPDPMLVDRDDAVSNVSAWTYTPGTPYRIGGHVLETPHINRLGEIDLRHLVRDLRRELATKDAQLHASAQIGQTLVERNNQLLHEKQDLMKAHTELNHALAEAKTTPASAAASATRCANCGESTTTDGAVVTDHEHDTSAEHAAHLELQVRHLEAELGELRSQLAETEATQYDAMRRYDALVDSKEADERTLRRRVAELESQVAERDQQIDEWRGKVMVLGEDKARLAEEKMDLVKKRNELAETANVAYTLQVHLHELEIQNSNLAAEKQSALQLVSERQAEIQVLEERVEVLEGQLDELVELRAEHHEALLTNDTLTSQLEELQNTIQILSAKLNALQNPQGISHPDDQAPAAAKTLLTEVEDKRRNLEERHERLGREHERLLRRHLDEGERLRRQIFRLQQLSADRTHDDHVKRLEAALAQAQAENRELVHRVAQLEGRQRAATPEIVGGATGPNDTDSVMGTQPDGAEVAAANAAAAAVASSGGAADVQDAAVSAAAHKAAERYLRMRIESLEADLRAQRKKLQTANMIKLNETAKLRAAEDELYQRDASVRKLNAAVSKLQYRIDELEANCDCPKPPAQPGTPVSTHRSSSARRAGSAPRSASRGSPAPRSATPGKASSPIPPMPPVPPETPTPSSRSRRSASHPADSPATSSSRSPGTDPHGHHSRTPAARRNTARSPAPGTATSAGATPAATAAGGRLRKRVPTPHAVRHPESSRATPASVADTSTPSTPTGDLPGSWDDSRVPVIPLARVASPRFIDKHKVILMPQATVAAAAGGADHTWRAESPTPTGPRGGKAAAGQTETVEQQPGDCRPQ